MSSSLSYPANFPRHIAIIMDGNGRWARQRHRPRVFGHRAGVKTVREIVEHASEIGVNCLTLYSFSTENWTRPKAEISALFTLMHEYVEDDLETLHNRNVRVRIIGSRQGLDHDMLELIARVESKTAHNTAFHLNIAFNYGGRDEMIRAVNRAAAAGENMTDITAKTLENYLDTHGLPDVDLVIRTSGEYRISNFLLWQSAYAEFVFTAVLWPDFTAQNLERAIAEFQSRERRFGNLTKALTKDEVA